MEFSWVSFKSSLFNVSFCTCTHLSMFEFSMLRSVSSKFKNESTHAFAIRTYIRREGYSGVRLVYLKTEFWYKYALVLIPEILHHPEIYNKKSILICIKDTKFLFLIHSLEWIFTLTIVSNVMAENMEWILLLHAIHKKFFTLGHIKDF